MGDCHSMAALLPRKEPQYPLAMGPGGVQGSSGQIQKRQNLLHPPGFDPLDQTTHSKSLYQVHYPGPMAHCTAIGIMLITLFKNHA